MQSVALYDTRLPERAPAALRAALAEGLDAAALTSPSSAEYLCAALPAGERAALLDRVLFACIGPTTAAALIELGAKRVVEAREQSDQGMVDALERAFEEERDAVS